MIHAERLLSFTASAIRSKEVTAYKGPLSGKELLCLSIRYGKKYNDLKIASSYVGMESGRTYQSASTRKLSFRVQMGYASLNSGLGEGLSNNENALTQEHALGTEKQETLQNQEKNTLEETQELENAQGKLTQTSSIRQIPRVNRVEEYNAIEDIRQQCIFYLWTIFFGKSRANEMADKMGIQSYNTSSISSTNLTQSTNWNTSGQLQQLQPVRMFSITAERETLYTETENTSFSTTGVVKTADGREINFNLDVSMSRSFSQYTKETVENVAAFIDPLVINLNGNIAEVSDQKFYFDLDADGEEELISRLCEDSGYLALDKNEDGQINDGSELFGTASGDGFKDLSAYDNDNNGWIDENDEIWNKLKIWVQDEQGNSQLYSLAEQGVGAICLQNASTEFNQRGTTGEINAAIRNTGIFLYENGNVGTIQHLDLAKSTAEKIAQYA